MNRPDNPRKLHPHIIKDTELRERVAEMFGKCFSETDKPTELCYDKAKAVINLIRGKE